MAKIMRLMNKIARCQSMYRTNKSTADLPGIYHSYVFCICKNPGLSQEKIAKNLCFNKSSVARHMAYLETNGYIERKTSPEDKRELLVYPTQKALDVWPIIEQMRSEWNDLILEDFSEEEVELLLKMMQKVQHKAMDLVKEVEEDD